MKSSAKQVHVFIRELCGPESVVLQQNNILQQVIQEVHHDPNIHCTLSEQQENIGQIVNEIYRLREELAKLKLTWKQVSSLLMRLVQNTLLFWKGCNPLQELGGMQSTEDELTTLQTRFQVGIQIPAKID